MCSESSSPSFFCGNCSCTFPYLHLQIPLVSLSVHKGNEGNMKGNRRFFSVNACLFLQ